MSSHARERRKARFLVSVLIPSKGLTLTTSSKPNYPQDPISKSVTLGVRASIHEFRGRGTIQSIANVERLNETMKIIHFRKEKSEKRTVQNKDMVRFVENTP